MKSIRIMVLPVLLLLLLTAAACRRTGKVDWSVSLRTADEAPYGASLAWQSLPAYFPAARIKTLSRDFRYTGINEAMIANSSDSVKLLVLHGLSFQLNDEEWGKLIDFIAQGNEVLLLSGELDDKITRPLQFALQKIGSELDEPSVDDNFGKANAGILRMGDETSERYGYYGHSIRSFFVGAEPGTAATAADDDDNEEGLTDDAEEIISGERPRPVVLGRVGAQPDFIRYSIGRGHLSLHSAPLVLSNYFLLQEDNKEYLDALWHSFPANVSSVYWQTYLYHFDNSYEGRADDTDVKSLFQYPATRNALLIAIALLLMYVLFHLRRRQRVVPVIPPLQNTSVTFVETVGKLYYNRHDHTNLAAKMVQHLFDWLRSRYNLDISQQGPLFEKALAAKSGKSEAEVADLMRRVHLIRLGEPFSEQQLCDLYQIVQSFYNQPSS